MKKNNMQTTNTFAKVFDIVLSIPGMNDNVKIQLTIPGKNVLLSGMFLLRDVPKQLKWINMQMIFILHTAFIN